jgi:UPF0042 nucleotide-binding protein
LKLNKLKIFFITGLSGSGKSTAISALEDAGFYCVDNMPVELLPKFLELPIENASFLKGLAFVMDMREPGFLLKYPPVFEELKELGHSFEILFLEASEEMLLQRFSQTRRTHPLATEKSLLDGIKLEREQLAALRHLADKVIDTSEYNVHQLKSVIFKFAQRGSDKERMSIHVVSFGFKHGIPYDADMIIDVRFAANPYFVPELKDKDGRSESVSNYVLEKEESQIFLKKYLDLLDYLLPLYEKEGKSYFTIALGCTGGQHRSVAIAIKIFNYLSKSHKSVLISHRDLKA